VSPAGIGATPGIPEYLHRSRARRRLLTGWHFDVVVVSPWSTAEIVLDQIRRYAPRAAVIVDTNDIHFLRLQRAAALSDSPPTTIF
jgi:hypothetical protein